MAAPLHIQQDFAIRVGEIHSIQAQQGAATHKAEASFDALLHRTFPGAL